MWNDVKKFLAGTPIMMDTSMTSGYLDKDLFLEIASIHGTDKILFGSDSPWGNVGDDIKALKECNLTQEEKKQIFFKNAERILKI